MSRQTDATSLPTNGKVVSKSINISAPPTRVWETLTIPELMKEWMSPTEIDVITDWRVGNPIVIRGHLHGVSFENKGTVLQFEPERVLQYSHLSSVSRLPDEPANYSVVEFRLAAITDSQTALTLTLSNFPTEVIYKHLAYYWNVTPRPAPDVESLVRLNPRKLHGLRRLTKNTSNLMGLADNRIGQTSLEGPKRNSLQSH